MAIDQVNTRQHIDSFCCGNKITVGYRRKLIQRSLRGQCKRSVYAMYTQVSPGCHARIAGWNPVANMDVLLFRVVCCQVAISARS